MQLENIYKSIQDRLSRIDFDALWHGFSSTKFAIYDETQVYFDGNYLAKTDEFLANTSIIYRGEHIAIWNVGISGSLDFDELTSKIVHEMFHAFQQQSHENRYPNELEAVQRYTYTSRNLTLKLEEAKYLKAFLQGKQPSDLETFLKLRQLRFKAFPYEANYEAQVEQIEGSAQYVECLALEQLNPAKGHAAWQRLLDSIQHIECYFPIRVISYDIGAVVLRALDVTGTKARIIQSNLPFSIAMLKEVEVDAIQVPMNVEIEKQISAYMTQTKSIIDAALHKQDCVLEGDFPLLGINVYNARCEGKYLTSTYFVMVEDAGQPRVLNGNFVIELNDSGRVAKVYSQA